MQEVRLRTSDGRKSIFIDSDFCKSLGVSHNNLKSCELFVASWLILLGDSPLCPTAKPLALFRKFLNSLVEKGLKTMVVEYSNLAHQLVSTSMLMGSGSLIGDWDDRFKNTPVFFEYNRYRKSGDPEILKYLYTFLNFGKKLEYEDESFQKIALRDWLGIEEKLSRLEYDENDIAAMRIILHQLLPTFSWRDLRPKFGPGSVQERGVYGRIGKLRNLQYSPIIDRFLLRGHIGMYGLGRDLGVSPDKIIPDPSRWDPKFGISSRVARLRFVPKNLKVARSICMEPNTSMYFQQAVSRRITELIESESLLRRFIRIGDQSRNRVLAEAGSISGDIDTLDLSAASDSVSIKLVKKIFPSSWLIPMLATRSTHAILPDGKTVKLEKFAPMGSALCFPTQCIIFACVCIYAAALDAYENVRPYTNEEFLSWLSSKNEGRASALRFLNVVPKPWERRDVVNTYQPLAVYGDDICVDGSLTDTVKSILVRLGFVVNNDKSFTGSQAFRESCGGYYLNGHDITPLYYRIKTVREKLTPNHVASHVHLINSCWERGYKNLYRFLHNSIMSWDCHGRFRNGTSWKNPIPYTSESDRFGILCIDPRNSHLEFRYNTDLQRTEVKAWTISYDHIERAEDNLLSALDSYEYMRWWASRSALTTTEDSSSVARYDTRAAGLKWRWIPLE